ASPGAGPVSAPMSSRPLRAALCGAVLLSLPAIFPVLACSSNQVVSSSASSSGTSAPPSAQPASSTFFSKTTQGVRIEIDYAAGAEPFQGNVKDFGDPWELFRLNASAIFDGKKPVTLPTTLAKMEKLADVPAKNFSNKDLLD